jgi:hypothetical protein
LTIGESRPREKIEELLADDDAVPEYEFGAILDVTVVEVQERGVLVEMHPNLPPVRITIAQLAAHQVRIFANFKGMITLDESGN